MTTETTLYEGLVALVKADPGVTAAAGVAQTMWPDQLPQNQSTGIVYLAAGGTSNPTFQTRGMDRVRMQFDCFAPSSAAVVAMRFALRQLLEGFCGPLPGGAVLTGCDYIQSVGGFENELRLVRKSAEFYLYVSFD